MYKKLDSWLFTGVLYITIANIFFELRHELVPGAICFFIGLACIIVYGAQL